MVFQSNRRDFISWYNPSQVFAAKHVSYPRLTATPVPPDVMNIYSEKIAGKKYSLEYIHSKMLQYHTPMAGPLNITYK